MAGTSTTVKYLVFGEVLAVGMWTPGLPPNAQFLQNGTNSGTYLSRALGRIKNPDKVYAMCSFHVFRYHPLSP